jgi:hypothetical protein
MVKIPPKPNPQTIQKNPLSIFLIPPQFDVPLPYFRNMENEKLIREKILEIDILAFELQTKKSDTVVVGSYVLVI